MDEAETPGRTSVSHEVGEMEFSMTTQLENLMMTPDPANASSNPERPQEDTGDTVSVPVDEACKTGGSDEDDSEDSDRYVHITPVCYFIGRNTGNQPMSLILRLSCTQ